MASNKGKQPAPKLDQGPDDQLLFDDKELDRIFNQEASLVQREQEVVRVLAAFKLNPYDILDLDHMPGANVSDQDIRASSALSSWCLLPLSPPPPLDHHPTRAPVPQKVPPHPPRQAQTPSRHRSL